MRTVSFPTRIISFFVFLCFLLVTRPTVSAGLYDELIASIETYIASDACELQPSDKSKSQRPIDTLKTEGLPSGQYRKALQELLIAFSNVSQEPEGQELVRKIAQALGNALQNPYGMLEKAAREYFETKCQAIPDSIQFSEKEGKGLQLGRVITFMKADDLTGQYKFHIKTHQLGSRSSQFGIAAGSAASIDPSEIFTYKLLELSGFGPEVHFFWENPHDFYIATLNVGEANALHRPLPNYSYAQIKKNPILLLADPSGPLSEFITLDKIPDEITPRQAANVNPVVMQGYIQIYIISQLLGLSDIIKNDGNVYFICENDNPNELTHIQIIDFAIVDNNTYMPQSPTKFQKIDKITQILFFLSFLNGAGSCRNSEDGIIRYLLVDQRTKDRFLSIKQVTEECNIKERFNESFSGALQFTEDLIKSLPISPTALRDFKRRTDDLSTRAKFLFQSIARHSDRSIEQLIAKYEGEEEDE